MELLIVVSVITILTGAMLPGFSSHIDNQNLKQAQEQVKSDLRTAQNNALAGVMAVDPNVKFWGIVFEPGGTTYDFFHSSQNTNCAESGLVRTSKSDQLPGKAVVKNTARSCVYFSTQNGDASFIPATSANIVIGAPTATGNNCKRISVNSVGLIENSASTACN